MFHVKHSFTTEDLMRLSAIINGSTCCKYILFQFTPRDVTTAGMNVTFVAKFKLDTETFFLYRKDDCSTDENTESYDEAFKGITWLFDITEPLLLEQCRCVVEEFQSFCITDSTRSKIKRKMSINDRPMNGAKRNRITEGSAAKILATKDIQVENGGDFQSTSKKNSIQDTTNLVQKSGSISLVRPF